MGKSRFRMPTAYTILFLLIVLVAIATWFIPAGAYEYADGVPVAGSYHPVKPSPQKVFPAAQAAKVSISPSLSPAPVCPSPTPEKSVLMVFFSKKPSLQTALMFLSLMFLPMNLPAVP